MSVWEGGRTNDEGGFLGHWDRKYAHAFPQGIMVLRKNSILSPVSNFHVTLHESNDLENSRGGYPTLCHLGSTTEGNLAKH